MKKALFITTISGFLPQFEMSDVGILQELGYEVHYASNFRNPVYPFKREDLRSKGIKLHNISVVKNPLKLYDNIDAADEICDLIDREGIDLVHCHNPMGAAIGRFASHFSKRKPYVIYTAHGLHFYRNAPMINWILYYPAEKIMAHFTDAIITINEEDYRRAKKCLSLKKNGFIAQIHSVGVDRERFSPKPGLNEEVRKELNIPSDAFHIVTAAELNNNKNQKVVIEAIAACKNDKIYYSICGKGKNKNRLKALIRRYGLKDRVRLLGFRTDMERVLQSADAFAFPSIREGLGVAAVEALSCGIPLIASDNRGTREYAKDGVNAIVCDSGSVRDFKEAIEKLSSDKNYRKLLANNCRESSEKFDKKEVRKAMYAIYKKAEELCLRSQS